MTYWLAIWQQMNIGAWLHIKAICSCVTLSLKYDILSKDIVFILFRAAFAVG